MKRKDTGILGEKLAQAFLKQKGYRILETNYRCLYGEIDIIARRDNSLVFIEVRTRNSLDYGTPEESITFAKKQHLEKTAEHYLQNRDKMASSWRIDMVAVELEGGNKAKRIEIIENVFG